MSENTLRLMVHDIQGYPWTGWATPYLAGYYGSPLRLRSIGNPEQRSEIRWYVEQFLDLPEAGNLVRARGAELILCEWADQLRQFLKQSDLCRRWLDAVPTAASSALEIISKTEPDKQGLLLPWELIDVKEGEPTPLHQYNASVVRLLSSDLDSRVLITPADQLRILVMVSRPDTEHFLDPRTSPAAILRAKERYHGVDVEFVRPGTLSALVEVLEHSQVAGVPFHVLHFDGHGHSENLCFEDDCGSLDEVSGARFASAISAFDISLVVLEACNTADDLSGQESVATALLSARVPAVVAMGYAAHIDMTSAFMATFYDRFCSGESIAKSLVHARKLISRRSKRRVSVRPKAATLAISDWFVPQLYQRTQAVILQVPRHRKKQGSLMGVDSLPAPPQAGFVGRAHELQVLERVILQHPIVNLHGVAGVGKSALAREAAIWWKRTGMFKDIYWISLSEDSLNTRMVIEAFQRRHPTSSSIEQIATLCQDAPRLIIVDGLVSFRRQGASMAAMEELLVSLSCGGSRVLLTSRDPRCISSLVASIDRLTEEDGQRLLQRFKGYESAPLGRLVGPNNYLSICCHVVGELDSHPLALELYAAALKRLDYPGASRVATEMAAESEQEHPEARNRSLRASLERSLADLSPPANACLPVLVLMRGGSLEWIASFSSGLSSDSWDNVRIELERSGLVRVDNAILRPHPLLGGVVGWEVDRGTTKRFLQGVHTMLSDYLRHASSSIPPGINDAMRISRSVIRRAINLAATAGDLLQASLLLHPFRIFLEREGQRTEATELVLSLYRDTNPTSRTLGGSQLMFETAQALAFTTPREALRILTALMDGLTSTDWSKVEPESSLMDAESRQKLLPLLRELLPSTTDLYQGDRVSEGVLKKGLIDRTRLLYLEVSARGRHQTEGQSFYSRQPTILQNGHQQLPSDTSDESASNQLRSCELITQAEWLLCSGRLDEASRMAEDAIALAKRAGNYSSVARELIVLSDIRFAEERFKEAEMFLKNALGYAIASDDEEAAALIQLTYTKVDLNMHRLEEATARATEALAIFRRAGDLRGQALAFNSLGNIERQRSEFTRALAWFDQAIELAVQIQDSSAIAISRGNRALVLSAEALKRDNDAERRTLLGQALAEQESVLVTWKHLGQQINVGCAYLNIARILRMLERLDEAEQHGRMALDILEESNCHLLAASVLVALDDIAEATADTVKAERWRSRRIVAEAWARGEEVDAKLPVKMVGDILRLAVEARNISGGGSGAGHLHLILVLAGYPTGFLDHLFALEPGLTRNFVALAEGVSRPKCKVSLVYQNLLEKAWESI